MQQGIDCDPTDPRQPVLGLTGNQFFNPNSLARLCTAVHHIPGMGEMRFGEYETNVGPSATRENFSMEKAVIYGTKVRVQEVLMLLLPLAAIMCCPCPACTPCR